MFYSYKVDDEIKLVVPQGFYAEDLFPVIMENYEHLHKWVPWLPDGYNIESTRNAYEESYVAAKESRNLWLLIKYKNKFVGGTGLNKFDFANRTTEIGYWLSAEYEGKGIVTRSCKALIEYAFEDLGFNRIEIKCATENTKSRAIPEKLGFTEEGVLREAEWLYDHFIDWAVYSLLAKDWREKEKTCLKKQ
jgi:ribosomal-protein-serine acetyltransferase